jgi:LPXTG-motif cell wall-anchored protein
VTPPPTDALGTTTGQPAGGTWLVLLALAGLLASLLFLRPRRMSPERRRR